MSEEEIKSENRRAMIILLIVLGVLFGWMLIAYSTSTWPFTVNKKVSLRSNGEKYKNSFLTPQPPVGLYRERVLNAGGVSHGAEGSAPPPHDQNNNQNIENNDKQENSNNDNNQENGNNDNNQENGNNDNNQENNDQNKRENDEEKKDSNDENQKNNDESKENNNKDEIKENKNENNQENKNENNGENQNENKQENKSNLLKVK